jgi:hypothetical protein
MREQDSKYCEISEQIRGIIHDRTVFKDLFILW